MVGIEEATSLQTDRAEARNDDDDDGFEIIEVRHFQQRFTHLVKSDASARKCVTSRSRHGLERRDDNFQLLPAARATPPAATLPCHVPAPPSPVVVHLDDEEEDDEDDGGDDSIGDQSVDVNADAATPCTTVSTASSDGQALEEASQSDSSGNTRPRSPPLSPRPQQKRRRDDDDDGNAVASEADTLGEPRKSRSLGRIESLFLDQATVATRLWAMSARDGGPNVTLIDREMQPHFIDSVCPPCALDWTPSGAIEVAQEEAANNTDLATHLERLQLDTQGFGSDKRKQRRGQDREHSQRQHLQRRLKNTAPSFLAHPALVLSAVTACLRDGGRNFPLEIFRTP